MFIFFLFGLCYVLEVCNNENRLSRNLRRGWGVGTGSRGGMKNAFG